MRSTTRTGTLFVLLLCFLSTFLFAQTHTPKTVNIITKCRGYYEYLPANYSTSQNKYPIIFYLHGGASYGNGSATQLANLLRYEGIPYYINQNQFPASFNVNGQSTSFIIITPQFSSKPSASEVKQVMDYIIPRYRVDTTRIYLTGYSVGGDVAWKQPFSLAAAYRLAAISPVAGYNNPYSDATATFIAGSGLPVWAIHSNSDATITVNASQNMVTKINSLSPGVPAIITRLNNVTHDNTVLAAYDPQFRPNGKSMYEWFLGYSRNFPPVARAGSDIGITMPVNSVNLDGNGSSDPENTPLLYNWSYVSGPSKYNIANGNSSTPTISNLVAGVYTFRLTVTDQALLVSSDSIRITVTNPDPNQLPIATAQGPQDIYLPTTAAIVTGLGSTDADGSIESYTWSKIEGPSSYTIVNPTQASTSINNLKVGIYRFRLVVTDNQGGSSSDTLIIRVINPFPNYIPVSRAGADQTITLPANSVAVTGSGSTDTDGMITGYQWRQLNGPSAGLIANPSNANTTIGNLQSGLYRFELKVTDDSTASHRDTILVTVNPAVKTIQVNLFGGSNGAGTGWTNWNVLSSLNSPALTYSNGTASGVTASLSQNTGVGDNGTNYPTVMCPPAVGRHASYSNTNRTLTISGLDNNKRYNFEAYATRAGGFATRFTIGSSEVNITTSNNYNSKAVFTDLAPNAGRITVSIGLVSTFTYLNGFTITEIASPTSANQSPVSRPGNAITINFPSSEVLLDGSLSSDPDGNVVSYLWQKISGPTAIITSPSQASTRVTEMTPGQYVFQLTVTDNGQLTTSEQVEVTVSDVPAGPLPPLARAGNDITIRLPTDSVLVDGSASTDPDGRIEHFLWKQESGPGLFSIIDSSNSSTFIKHMIAGSYVVSLTVTDSTRLTAKDSLRITVIPANISPVASAGTDRQLILPDNSLQLDGSANDTDGSISKYQWRKLAGPVAFEISDSAIKNPVISGLQSGVYWLALIVTDNDGASGADTLLVTVHPPLNLKPTANAGVDQVLKLPVDSTVLSASASSDADGSIISYEWTQLSGPAQATIVSANTVNTPLVDLQTGSYSFTVTVTDDSSALSIDTIVVTVLEPNKAPFAEAGADRYTTLPENSMQLDAGNSVDTDGTIVTYTWSKLTGPASYNISYSDSAKPLITNLVSGDYIFRLVVTDNDGAMDDDTVTVIVYPARNMSPVANAGTDISLKLPQNTVTLDGVGSADPDGIITRFFWSQISGPDNATSSPNDEPQLMITGLQAGTYLFELAVTDDSLAIHRDSVEIFVAPPNVAPSANAGDDKEIILPLASTQVNGGASTDTDGQVVNYGWKQISGPSTLSFSTPTNQQTTVTNLVAGLYSIELLVSDNEGLADRDTVDLRVYPALNIRPKARAGNDQTITLPVNSVSLSGITSSDEDGSIISYQWFFVNGNSPGTISNPNSVSTTVNNLQTGIHQLVLQVIDDSLARNNDTVAITVLAAVPVQRRIKVNLFSGSSPAGSDWNNWNVISGLTMNNLKYEDGTASGSGATLSNNTNVGDNGNGYAITMCPAVVGRFASYSTSNRTLTIQGLDNNKRYDFEGYASRTGGTPTRFTIGGNSVTINTDRNFVNKASFTNITPVGGRIVIQMDKVTTWSYLNGFILTEHTVTTESVANRVSGLPGQESVVTNMLPRADMQNLNNDIALNLWQGQFSATTDTLSVAPNPFNSRLGIRLSNAISGSVQIMVMDHRGQIIRQWSDQKSAGSFSKVVEVGSLPRGTYLVIVKMNGWQKTSRVIRY